MGQRPRRETLGPKGRRRQGNGEEKSPHSSRTPLFFLCFPHWVPRPVLAWMPATLFLIFGLRFCAPKRPPLSIL